MPNANGEMEMQAPCPAVVPAPRALRRRRQRAQLRLVLGVEVSTDDQTVVRALRSVKPRGVLGVSDAQVARCIRLLLGVEGA